MVFEGQGTSANGEIFHGACALVRFLSSNSPFRGVKKTDIRPAERKVAGLALWAYTCLVSCVLPVLMEQG